LITQCANRVWGFKFTKERERERERENAWLTNYKHPNKLLLIVIKDINNLNPNRPLTAFLH